MWNTSIPFQNQHIFDDKGVRDKNIAEKGKSGEEFALFQRPNSEFFLAFIFSVERRIMVLERDFQKKLIKEIENRLPGCYVLKNDPNYIQGIPDLTVLYHNRWGMLEVKNHAKAKHQPNQEYYVDRMNNDSFAAFVYPENKDDVLDKLQCYMVGVSSEVNE